MQRSDMPRRLVRTSHQDASRGYADSRSCTVDRGRRWVPLLRTCDFRLWPGGRLLCFRPCGSVEHARYFSRDPALRPGAKRALAIALLLSVGWGSTACSTPRGFGWLHFPASDSRSPELPELHSDPPASLPGPEGLRAIGGELRSVPLKWDPLLAGDVGGYVLERAAQGSEKENFVRVAVTSGRFHTVAVDATGLSDGITYRYRVRAYAPDGGLSQATSAVISVTTAPVPASPDGLRAYSQLPRSVALTWQASPNPAVAGYIVYRSPSSRGPFDTLTRTAGRFSTTYVDQNLGDLRLFYYRVAAYNAAGGEGEKSTAVRGVTKPEPLPPLDLRVVKRELGANHLTWEANVERDLAGYRVERWRAEQEHPETVAVLGPKETSTVDHAVGAQEEIRYSIVAFDRDGLESVPADSISVTAEGHELRAAVAEKGIRLAWNPRKNEGFAAARVYRLRWFGRSLLGRTETGQFLYTTAEPGATYRFAIELEHADGGTGFPSQPIEISVPKTPSAKRR